MDRNEVISKIKSDGALHRCQGIILAAKAHLADEEVVKELKKLKNDDVIVFGRSVSWYATAALEMAGIEKYAGDDTELIRFISEFPSLVSAA